VTNIDQFTSLDQLDIQLIAELESDPRQSSKAIAAKLGVNASTITSRTRRLIDHGVIRPVCMIEPKAVGYKFIVLLTIQTQPGWARDVADKLAAIDRVLSVQLCTGLFDVIAWTMFRTGVELSDFISNELKSVPCLLHIETTLMLDEIKAYPPKVRAEKETHPGGYKAKDLVKLDDLDLELMRELQRDARQNSVQLGRKLGVYQSRVFRRIQRLLDERIIRIALYSNPVALEYEGIATACLKCYPGKIKEVADAIASYDEVQYISICTGRCDVLAWLVFKTLSDLRHFITVELGSISGLRDMEIMVNYKQVKMPWRIII
jgi:DNA-binding Lrp family transcriptional regulator